MEVNRSKTLKIVIIIMLFLYLLFAVLSLCCCVSFSLIAMSGGSSLAVVYGLLIAADFLVRHRLLGMCVSVAAAHGL